MLGDGIIQGTVILAGSAGTAVMFDLADQDMHTLKAVVVQNASSMDAEVLTAPASSLASLLTYTEASDPPNAGYCQVDKKAYVFIDTDVYPFTSETRVGFIYARNAVNVDATGDTVDVPNAAKELLKAVVLTKMYQQQGKRVPLDMTNRIAAERNRLGV